MWESESFVNVCLGSGVCIYEPVLKFERLWGFGDDQRCVANEVEPFVYNDAKKSDVRCWVESDP